MEDRAETAEEKARMFGSRPMFWATPGGLATDLVILASTLLALAGLLFIAYVVAVVASVVHGVVRGPLPSVSPVALGSPATASRVPATTVGAGVPSAFDAPAASDGRRSDARGPEGGGA
ncbi:hypothetical protein [Mobilicoccus sp.]|uniref:hypothetical protein n=1 Tax=Mobilicoccus sp. TaxID=2034349 RepID=UPI0028AAABE6|nr:hypothetical protein [Mobilicoccus sp.]